MIVQALSSLVVSIDTVRPDPSNTRLHPRESIDAIKRSLERFGQQKPIVARADGTIIAGSGFYQAAKELGWTEIAVVKSDLAAAEAVAYGIADNRTTDLSENDPDALRTALASLDPDTALAAGFDQSALSDLLSTDDLARVLGRGRIPGAEASWDDVDGSGEDHDEDHDEDYDEDAEAATRFGDLSDESEAEAESNPGRAQQPLPSGVAPDPSSGYLTIILTGETEPVQSLRSALNRLRTEFQVGTHLEVVQELIHRHESLSE